MMEFAAGAADVAADIRAGAVSTRTYRYNERTAANLERHWRANAAVNAEARAASALPFRGLLDWLEKPEYFLGRDVVVCGAGPSLDAVLPQIRLLVQTGCDVWAADAALAPLLAAGVTPTAVLTVDPQPGILPYFEGVELPPTTALVVANIAHPGVWRGRRPADEVVWYGIAAPAEDVISEINSRWPRELACVAGLGNVTSLAVGVCEVLGYRKIAIAGFNLSYGGGRYYCENILSVNAGKTVSATAAARLERIKRFEFGIPHEFRQFEVEGFHGQPLVAVDAFELGGDGVLRRDVVWSDPNLLEYARQFSEMGAALGWGTTDPHVMVLGSTIVSPAATKIGRVFTDEEKVGVDAGAAPTELAKRSMLRGAPVLTRAA